VWKAVGLSLSPESVDDLLCDKVCVHILYCFRMFEVKMQATFTGSLQKTMLHEKKHFGMSLTTLLLPWELNN
jgi:hypothetical protein